MHKLYSLSLNLNFQFRFVKVARHFFNRLFNRSGETVLSPGNNYYSYLTGMVRTHGTLGRHLINTLSPYLVQSIGPASVFFFFFLVFVLRRLVLGIKPRALCTLGKCCTAELHPEPSQVVLTLKKTGASRKTPQEPQGCRNGKILI